MKTAVIYTSQTGFTKRYAEWIANNCGADCMDISDAKKRTLEEYDAIVFGGWICAGGISKLNWFKSNMDKWQGKKLIVYAVGGSPMENPDVEVLLKNIFTEEEHKQVSAFYCPGGFNYEKMSAGSKVMMKMFIKALKAKKNKAPEEEIMIKMISSSYDISDIKYIEPILSCLN